MAIYYPPNQIRPNLTANSGEFIYASNNLPFSGLYHQLSNGRYYTGALHSNDSVEIIPISSITQPSSISNDPRVNATLVVVDDTNTTNSIYSRLINQDTTPKELPVNLQNLPTEQDYQIGEFTRYFSKQINQDSYLEFDKTTYDRLISKDPSIYYEQYIAFKMPWRLIGNKEQVYKINRNITVLISQQLNLLKFGRYLKDDYLKYYKFPNISNLYTSGGEFKTKDGQNYIGFYHIHDNTGPMVGATHTREPHGLLFPINEAIISQVTTQSTTQITTQTTSSYTQAPINTGGGGFSGRGGGGGY